MKFVRPRRPSFERQRRGERERERNASGDIADVVVVTTLFLPNDPRGLQMLSF
jgi:hypothetical protein